MSDPADKSDDLIAELAKLMAASPSGNQPPATPVAKAPPLSATPQPTPPPVRIPGMDQFRPAMPVQPTAPVQPAAPVPPPVSVAPAAPSAAPPVASRGPVTGAIRIPGMDNPAPVSTSAPVSKFDFGSKPAAAPIRQEPLSTLAERLAPQNPANRVEPSPSVPNPPPVPIRIPSDLKPVSENRSFAQGPALTVTSHPTPAPSAPAASPASDITFDFGFAPKPPAAPTPAAPAEPAEAHDPIADLIAAELADDEAPEPAPPPRQEFRPVPAVPIARTVVTPQPAPPKPVVAPVAAAAPRQASTQPIPLKPVSVAPRAPEADRFAISPGVGLNMKPPASQPLAPPVQRAPEPKPEPIDSDPMAEIESLIGEAVRVELAPPGPVRVQSVQPVTPHVQLDNDDDDLDDEDDRDHDEDEHEDDEPRRAATGHAPVVPPLNSQFAPRRAGLKDDVGPSSAEDAILAAAAATGAEVDRIDPPTGEESPYRRLKVKPARSSWASGGIRQYVGMAVAGTLLLAAGLGLYWVLNMGRGNTIATANDAPQLTADATPVKEVPEVQPDAQAETPRSPVLEQMGGTSTAPADEQLVSTDETGGGSVPRDVTQVAAADTEGGLANRKVRTVTVRPDGTIVSGDDAVAGAETLPVARPNVPEVPSISAETPSLLSDPAEVAATETSTTPAPLTVDTSVAPVEPTTTLPGADVPTVFDANVRAPSPLPVPGRDTPAPRSETVTAFAQEPAAINLTGAQTPNGQIDLLGGQIEPVQVAATQPVAVDAGSAAAYVQLSSSPSQADAESSRRALNNRYGSLFGGTALVIQPADLGQKGTWYRVKLPASSLADAQSKCASIKANGGDCIVSGS